MAPHRNSMRISVAVARGGKATGTNAADVDGGAGTFGKGKVSTSPGTISALLTQRRNRFALTPCAIATAAIETPGCMHAATALALNSSL